jgi:hypothetical protein
MALSNEFPPLNRVLLEKLKVAQLATILPACWGTQKFITTFTRAHHCLYPVLNHFNPVHNQTHSFLKINFNNILATTSKSLKWSHLFRFSEWTYVCIFLSPLCMLYAMSHPFLSTSFSHPNNIWLGLQIMNILIMKGSPTSHYLLSLFSTLSSQAPSFHVIPFG